MTAVAYDRLTDRLRELQKVVKTNGRPNQAKAQCPAHDDKTPSLSITGIEGQVLVHCHAGCPIEAVLDTLNMTKSDLYDEPRGATYVYEVAPGQIQRTAHRTPDKKFWQSGDTQSQPILYRLPQIAEAVAAGQTIYLVEGEKDVNALESIGLVATTAPMGADNFHKVDVSPLTGADIIAIPDRDNGGKQWTQQVQTALKPIAKGLQFKLAKVGKDAADHIAAGYEPDDLLPVAPPQPGEDELEPHQDATTGFQFTPGDNFILDTEPTPRPIWGEGDQVLSADGEALIIAAPQGLGKTTLAQQLALGWIDIPSYSSLLGFPITSGMRVLYLAMDRPRQAARSFRRMVGEEHRAQLHEQLTVWQGPPPGDLAKYPSLLLELCKQASADAVIVDSLKDAAVGLSDDEVGAGYNRARQNACTAGVQVLELHHLRKALTRAEAEHPTIDGVYGSTWITSGAGSVVLLNGKPGDPIVSFHHIKQPASEVGPFKIIHDHDTGRSKTWHSVDLVLLAKQPGGLTAVAAAMAIFETGKPTPNEKDKARRRLDKLTSQGRLKVIQKGDAATNKPKIWAVK